MSDEVDFVFEKNISTALAKSRGRQAGRVIVGASLKYTHAHSKLNEVCGSITWMAA